MKIRNPNTWLLIAVVVIGTIAAKSCSAQGFYNRDGQSHEGVSPGLQYYSGSDREYGWQSETNGQSYFHSNKRSCWSNHVLGNTRTVCHDY